MPTSLVVAGFGRHYRLPSGRCHGLLHWPPQPQLCPAPSHASRFNLSHAPDAAASAVLRTSAPDCNSHRARLLLDLYSGLLELRFRSTLVMVCYYCCLCCCDDGELVVWCCGDNYVLDAGRMVP